MGFPDSSVGKEFTAIQQTVVWFLGWEDMLQKGQATHSTVLGLPLWLNWKKKKKSACNAGELGFTPGLGRASGEGKGYPFQYSGLENSMNCIVPGVTKNQSWLSDFQFLFFFFYCSGFCHTLKWNSHGFICVPHPDPPSHLPLHPIPLGLPSAPGPSSCLMHPTWAVDLFHPW